jgi:hypothetical protein
MGLLDGLRGDDTSVPQAEFSDGIPDDLRAEIVPDPVPGKSRAKPARAPKPPAAGKPVPVAVKRRLTDELEAYAGMAALAWTVRDPVCGPVLNDQARQIAEALAEIIARNAQLVAWIETTGMVGDWVKLWMAIAPVVSAVRAHHITKSVGGNDEGTDDDLSRYAVYRPSA